MAVVLTAIQVYPVKSCRGVALDEVEIVPTGLAGDRVFQVVDTGDNPITQRQKPILATVQPALEDDVLTLEADGCATLTVPVPTPTSRTTANSVIGVPVEAADAGDEAADWFTILLGEPARLVAIADGAGYPLPLPGVDMNLSWADAAEVLVTNTASFDWLAGRGSEPFGMDRFRPNLVVDATEPWVEDTWRDFSIGAARLGEGLAWPRCVIPQVDQVSGRRHNEPAKVLKEYRWCTSAPDVDAAIRPLFEGKSLFGIGCSIGPVGARIAVGDEVTVHTTDEPVIPAPY